MIRITRETDYGIVLLTSMARDIHSPCSAATLAKQHRMPGPMVSKILKALTRAGLLTSQRGAQGGYTLTRAPEAISAADIIDAIEGPIAITPCSDEVLHACVYESHCAVSGHWHRINQAIREALENITLLDMSRPPPVPLSMLHDGILTAAGSTHHR